MLVEVNFPNGKNLSTIFYPLCVSIEMVPKIAFAPLFVSWLGFGLLPKVIIVFLVCFFPIVLNAILAFGSLGVELTRFCAATGAGPLRTFFKVRLPAAMPFIFNALKINSTLALIGAIVAEFFGTPIVGMGFRISAEVGRMNIDLVWATIAVAALAGSLFYGLIVLIERHVTFWHPSIR